MTLRDVFGWARVKGMTCPGSRAGSLLRAIAGTDWDEAQIDDIANDFEAMLEDWRYSSDEHISLLDGNDFLRRDELGGDEQMLDETPGPMLMGAARALHHACRITRKIAWTREDTDSYGRWLMMEQQGSSSSQAPIILHAPVAPVTQTVNVADLLDYGKNQAVPLISDDVFYKGIENWRRIVGHGM